MAKILNRTDFKTYCLRRLGYPVIEINVDDDQVEDRVDEAIEYWQDCHFDGLQKLYYVKAISPLDVGNKYFDLSNVIDQSNNAVDIVGVTRIFPISDSQSNINMFDLRYQLRLNELYDFTSASYVNYTLTQQHLRSLEIMFTGEVPIRFQRHMQRLFIDWNWGNSEAPLNQIVIVECYASLNPNFYVNIWNDRWLKRYATALIKRSWGNNMKKYTDVMLPGGIKMNGQQIYDEAIKEISDLETEMITSFSGPLEIFMN